MLSFDWVDTDEIDWVDTDEMGLVLLFFSVELHAVVNVIHAVSIHCLYRICSKGLMI